MTKQKKLLLKELLKQYKQSLNESVIPKKGDTISIDMKVVNQHALKQGTAGKHWLSIIRKMLKNSGNDTLLVHSVNDNYVDVSGWSGDSILGTAQLPIGAIKTIVKQSKRRIKESRDLNDIAQQIYKDWKNVNYAAKPYLQAMRDLSSISDNYGYDSGSSIVAYFLSNASQWKGEKAKQIKAQLNKMLKDYYKNKH